jgi:hypothetical protein
MRAAGDTLCRYRTDADGHLVFVDAGWRAFALANDAAEYAAPQGLYGRALLSFISEPTTRYIYSVLMQRVVNHHTIVLLPFRCDAPDERRWFELRMTPHEGGIEFATRVLSTQPRTALIPAAAVGQRDAMLRMCSWCKDVELAPGHWGSLEEAVTRFGLFRDTDPPSVTHGICQSCVGLFERDPRR